MDNQTGTDDSKPLVDVRLCAFSELANSPQRDVLLAEYADECRILGLPHPNAHVPTYEALNNSGIMYTILARVGDELVGFALLLINIVPHYGVPIACTESLFVRPSYRRTGAGMQLLHMVETVAEEQGAHGLLVSTPHNGQLARVMNALSRFRETNVVYFKAIK